MNNESNSYAKNVELNPNKLINSIKFNIELNLANQLVTLAKARANVKRSYLTKMTFNSS